MTQGSSTAASASYLTRTVLVVDDDTAFRQQVTRVLEEAGYTCERAENGLEALRLGLKKRYDLIVTDVEMPGLDGLKFVARMRLGAINAQTPVVVLSSTGAASTVGRAKKLGVEAYLLKPVFPEDLLAQAIRLAGLPPEPPAPVAAAPENQEEAGSEHPEP